MSTDAGTEEHRVSDTLLPMPRRIAQLPSLPNQDASTRLCCNAALAAHAGDGNRAAPAGDRLSQESTGEKLRQPLGAKSDRTVGGIFGMILQRDRGTRRHRPYPSLIINGALAAGIEPLAAGPEQDRIELDHRPGSGVHGELESLASELVTIADRQLLCHLAQLVPGLGSVPFRVEANLLEVLRVEVIGVAIEPQRIAERLVVLDRARDEGRREVCLEGIQRGVAKALHIKGDQQILVEPEGHEPVLADEALGRGAGGEANADLLAQITEREPLEVHRDIRMRIGVLLDAFLQPRPLLRIVKGPEAKVHWCFALSENAAW